MNLLQIVGQLAFTLEGIEWGGVAPAQKVFENVQISQATILELVMMDLKPPFAVVAPGNVNWDPKTAGYSDDAEVVVRLAVMSDGDKFGENVLMGSQLGPISATQNRGMLEVEREMFRVVKYLNTLQGINLQLISQEEGASVPLDGTVFISEKRFGFKARITDVGFQHAHQSFSVGAVTANSIELNWALPIARFDFASTIIRRAVGSVAPAGPEDGVGVVIANPKTDTSVVDGGLAGATTYSYSIFGGYNPRARLGDATAEQFSKALNLTQATS